MRIFRDTVPTSLISFDIASEGFVFNQFDSRQEGWYLESRDAPTPAENEIIEKVAYRPGVYDFSTYKGERFFDNRTITYKLSRVANKYHDRKFYEEKLKRRLMPAGISNLYDTHDEVYYWQGKCKSVVVEDDQPSGMLNATVVFACYPYAFTNNLEGADIWDDVDFDHWIWQPVKFDVSKSMDIVLENIGSRPVLCKFGLTGKVTVKTTENTLELDKDNYAKSSFVLNVGKNKITLSGSGTIEFKFRREEML